MIASAPGKIILFGEHAVVYGRHALVAAINLRCRVEVKKSQRYLITSPLGKTGLDFKVHPYISFAIRKFSELKNIEGVEVKVDSEIPIASGLGSSAAVVVATIKALDAEFEASMSDEEIFEMAKQVEMDVQGASSGIDPFVATHGGAWIFPERKKVDIKQKFFLINLGQKSTAKMVSSVYKLRTRYPELTDKIFDAIDLLACEAAKLKDLEKIEELISINQSLLRAIGVSTPEIDETIAKLERQGFKAKITGAGGGGCIYGIVKDKAPEGSLIVEVSQDGAKIEDS